MRRWSTVVGGVGWPEGSRRLARWLNPALASPEAPSQRTTTNITATG
jgi:hypothetical protein